MSDFQQPQAHHKGVDELIGEEGGSLTLLVMKLPGQNADLNPIDLLWKDRNHTEIFPTGSRNLSRMLSEERPEKVMVLYDDSVRSTSRC